MRTVQLRTAIRRQCAALRTICRDIQQTADLPRVYMQAIGIVHDRLMKLADADGTKEIKIEQPPTFDVTEATLKG